MSLNAALPREEHRDVLGRAVLPDRRARRTPVDARSAAEYDTGHIPGAINVPIDRLSDYLNELTSMIDVDAEVVCYCNGPSCDFSDQLATELKFLGYTRVMVFTGGWEHWEAAGYEIESTGAIR